jgi:hypothetical protein
MRTSAHYYLAKKKLFLLRLECPHKSDLAIASFIFMMQMDYLDHWAMLQTDHSTSLSGAIEALRASTLRLPVTGGAKVSAVPFPRNEPFLELKKNIVPEV